MLFLIHAVTFRAATSTFDLERVEGTVEPHQVLLRCGRNLAGRVCPGRAVAFYQPNVTVNSQSNEIGCVLVFILYSFYM